MPFTIFCYVIQDPIIDNKKIIEDLANSGEIENINYDLDFKKTCNIKSPRFNNRKLG